MRFGACVLTVVLGAASCAAAAPLDLAGVSAQAAWVAHVDVDAARASVLCQRLYQKLVAARPEVAGQLDALRGRIGFDVRKDLRGVTAYGSKIGRNDGVLLVRVAVDRTFLVERVRQAPDHALVAYRTHEVHSWTDAKGKKNERPVAGAFHGGELIVLAPTADQVKTALDVLDGRLPSLQGSASPLSAASPGGAMVVLRAVGLSRAELPYKSPLVTESESLQVAAGERQGEAFAEAKVVAKSPEIAAQVKSLLEGLRAMAELQQAAEPDVARLIKRFQVEKADTNAVRIEFRAPVDELWAMIEKDWMKKAAAQRGKPGSESGSEQ